MSVKDELKCICWIQSSSEQALHASSSISSGLLRVFQYMSRDSAKRFEALGDPANIMVNVSV